MSNSNQPNVLAIIPARGGSKGVGLKNLRKVGGISLLARAIKSAKSATTVSEVVVSTDHEQIRAEALAHGATVVDRPAEIAGDTASSEAVLLHVLAGRESTPDVTLFIQCTSPFINPQDLDAAVTRVASGAADVTFAAVADHGFLWATDEQDAALAIGHDAAHRPRRQDRAPQFRETGAFYAMRTAGLLQNRHRFFGTVQIHQVPTEHGIDIDTEADLALANHDFTATDQLIDVDAVVTDFDGVHTPDTAYLDEYGNESVRVSRSDGMGVERLRAAGIKFLILSKERNKVVSARAAKLNVEVAQGIESKADYLGRWMADESVNPARVAYLGNDINDVPAMELVGWPITVADARPEAHRAARHRLTRAGGTGAVRELAELVLAARNK
ncbi:acylneuraminate cytidylyltransferase [Glutamicibacter sp. MNS18]|uniref:acylneuraminate cytidylyltransferase n=1 Tax=Glutamicibacter sp. MNS18 TaxID=2989817 RepID=UPI0022362E66|nr:acylneuraminate cytidylyltransferase [Glutamicibacter sp. MNS18]MCW4467114.1 acylneuraminate cytidylyltransferase [Glutamicibacter sp. MNS18]